MKAPIFLVSAIRSGSTILSECLDRHKALRWLRGSDKGELSPEWSRLTGIELSVVPTGNAKCGPVGADIVTEEMRVKVYSEMSSLVGNKRFVGKNPHFWNKLPFLKAVFPDVQLIVVSRDLESCVFSTQTHWMRTKAHHGVSRFLPEDNNECWWLSPPADFPEQPERIFPGGSVAILADYWLRVYDSIERNLQLFEDPIFVRHGDLLKDPEATMNSLFQKLGLDPLECEELPKLDGPQRNKRWRALLTRREITEITHFRETHKELLESLTCASY